MNIYDSQSSMDAQEHANASRPDRAPTPRTGDLLVAKRTARDDVYTIGVIPRAAFLIATRQQTAFDVVHKLARTRGVDVWYTCDHTHFVAIARFRT